MTRLILKRFLTFLLSELEPRFSPARYDLGED